MFECPPPASAGFLCFGRPFRVCRSRAALSPFAGACLSLYGRTARCPRLVPLLPPNFLQESVQATAAPIAVVVLTCPLFCSPREAGATCRRWPTGLVRRGSVFACPLAARRDAGVTFLEGAACALLCASPRRFGLRPPSGDARCRSSGSRVRAAVRERGSALTSPMLCDTFGSCLRRD